MRPLHKDDPRQIGGHRLVAVLGEGATAQVFLGATPESHPIVLKVVRPLPARDPGFRTRFAHDVASAERVECPYVVPVLESCVDGPVLWLATVYTPGPGLDEAVAKYGPLPPRTVRTLAAGLASALDALHAVGLTHGRLGPTHVALAPDGPRVVDLGVARSPDGPSVTDAGVVVGTVLPSPAFRAPEQLGGGTVGPAADVFSLGCVIVHAATGTGPFGADTSPGTADRVVHAIPDLRSLPSWLRELAGACLAKNPADRPTPAQVYAATASDLDGPGWLPHDVAAEVAQRAAAVWAHSGAVIRGAAASAVPRTPPGAVPSRTPNGSTPVPPQATAPPEGPRFPGPPPSGAGRGPNRAVRVGSTPHRAAAMAQADSAAHPDATTHSAATGHADSTHVTGPAGELPPAHAPKMLGGPGAALHASGSSDDDLEQPPQPRKFPLPVPRGPGASTRIGVPRLRPVPPKPADSPATTGGSTETPVGGPGAGRLAPAAGTTGDAPTAADAAAPPTAAADAVTESPVEEAPLPEAVDTVSADSAPESPTAPTGGATPTDELSTPVGGPGAGQVVAARSDVPTDKPSDTPSTVHPPAAASPAPVTVTVTVTDSDEPAPEVTPPLDEIIEAEIIEAELVDDDEPLPPRASVSAPPGVTDLPGKPAGSGRRSRDDTRPRGGRDRTSARDHTATRDRSTPRPHSTRPIGPQKPLPNAASVDSPTANGSTTKNNAQQAKPVSPTARSDARAERRRFLAWVAGGAAVLAGAATGAVLWGDSGGKPVRTAPVAGPPPAPIPAAAQSTDLRVWFHQGSVPGDQVPVLAEELRGVNNRLNLHAEEKDPAAGYTQTLIAELNGGGTTAPDIFEVDLLSVASHLAAGRIADLTPHQARFDTNSWLPAMRSAVTFDDKAVALPLTASVPVVLYHQGMYAAAGVPVPRTREQWVDGLERLRAHYSGVPAFRPLWLPGRSWPVLASLMWESDGALALREGEAWRGTFDLPGSIDGVRFFRRLQQYAPEVQDLTDRDLKLSELFARGHAASVIGPASLHPVALATEPGLAAQLNAFPIPGRVDDGPGSVGVRGTALVVSSKCRDIPAAVELLALLATDKWRALFAQAGGTTLSPRLTPEQLVLGTNPMLRAGASAAGASGHAYPTAPGWSERPVLEFGRAVLAGTDAMAAAAAANQMVAAEFGRTTG